MPSDYQEITKYNEEQLGKDTASRKSQVNMYSDFSHFIYEILQNADDYNATVVTFRLKKEELVIEHNGISFKEKNVKAISYFGKSTSRDVLVKTGRFGLGFKSVFAFTASPSIASGDESFEIYGLYRLKGIPRPHDLREEQTRIRLPFNHMVKRPDYVETFVEKEKAFDKISFRLKNIDLTTLLFTRNIAEIKWTVQGEEGNYEEGHYLREDKLKRKVNENFQTRRTEITDGYILHTYLVFTRPIEWEGEKHRPVDIAFYLDESGETEVIRTCKQALFVLFPTTVETRLGFLMNGPFRTPAHRETVSQDDTFNQFLVKEIANVLCQSLFEIKAKGLLSVSFLKTLPIKMDDFPKDSMFYPIVKAVRDALLKQELLPADDGTFVSAQNAKLASADWLRKLLRQEQLKELFQSDDDIKWLSGEITQYRTSDLRSYLMAELNVEEITPDGFARRISSTFLASQTDDWFIAFYKYLSDQETLWRPPRRTGDSGGLLRRKPILRLQDNRQEVPFGSDGIANAYLPPQEETDFHVVKREIAYNEQALEFLNLLGLSKPDIFDDIVERVLPKYIRQDVSSITPREHATDIQKILRAMTSDSEAGKKKVLRAAKNEPFLKAVDQNGNSSFKRPDELYFPNEKLKIFFSGCDDIWFLDETTGEKVWKTLGVENKPRFKRISIELDLKEKNKLRGKQGHTRDIETIDYKLEGLENFFEKYESGGDKLADHSLILWNFLLDHLKECSYYNFYEGEYKWFYYYDRFARFDASWKKQVAFHAWLPKEGDTGFYNPHDLTQEDLPDSFIRYERLADILGMKKDEVKRIEEKTGGKFIPKDEYEEFQKWKTTKFNKYEKPEFTDKICYKEELQKSFNRLGQTELQEQALDIGKANNVERRRGKSYEEHKKRLDHEPKPNERRKETKRTILEGPDEQVREYLSQFYDGKCQICGKTFPARDGSPFFIAKYFVNRNHAHAVDTPANALCLCADHFAKWQHGAVEAEDIIEQIENFKTKLEGGKSEPILNIKLCGETCTITYKEKHLLDLQELLRASKTAKEE